MNLVVALAELPSWTSMVVGVCVAAVVAIDPVGMIWEQTAGSSASLENLEPNRRFGVLTETTAPNAS